MCANPNYLGPFRNRFPLKFVPETSIGQFFIIKPIRNCRRKHLKSEGGRRLKQIGRLPRKLVELACM
jgi:hypothetical protein